MTTVLPDEYKTSIRVITFKGEQDNWSQWKIKTRAIDMKKKWVEALDKDLSYEEEETKSLSVSQIAEKKLNDDAWNYLVMACNGEPFDIITSETETNAFKGWKLLKEEYEPSTDEALVNVQEKFVTCKMISNSDLSLIHI